MAFTPQLLARPDGRVLEWWRAGATAGPALLLHHGTPLDAGIWGDWEAAATTAGLQLVALTRPGYARSTRRIGRRVSDVADDAEAVLAAADAPWFVTAGWSGGGPHALACAVLVPGCRAVATIAGVGPANTRGLDFLAGMGPENVAEFGAAVKGEAALRAWLGENAEPMRHVTGSDLAAAFGGLVSHVDIDALGNGYAEAMAAAIRRSLSVGFDGWIDDDLAFTDEWGFDLRAVCVPATIWQSDLDLMVPFAHGEWLARTIPDAQPRLVAGHGHISLGIAYRDAIVAGLLDDAARLAV